MLDDLTCVPDQVILDRALSSLGQLVLGVLKHGMDRNLGNEFFRVWQEPIQALLGPGKGIDELRTVMWYLLQVNPTIEQNTLGAMMMENFGPEAEQVVLTAGQRMLHDSRLAGRQEGRQEGQVALLLKQLEHRFGALRPEIVHQVKSAEADSIDRWAAGVLDAATLSDVFAD